MMGWSAKFNRSIELSRGNRLRTLAEARDYVLALPRSEQQKPHWEAAAGALTLKGQQAGNHTMFSEIGLRQALTGASTEPKPRPAKLPRKNRIIS